MLDRQKQVSFCDHQVPICYYSSFVLLYEQFLPTLSNGYGLTTSSRLEEQTAWKKGRKVWMFSPFLHLFSWSFIFFFFQIFDERTGQKSSVPMTFWSVYGEKVSKNKEKRLVIDAIKQNDGIFSLPSRPRDEGLIAHSPINDDL